MKGAGKMKIPSFSHSLSTEFKRVSVCVELKFEKWGIILKIGVLFFSYTVHCDWNN